MPILYDSLFGMCVFADALDFEAALIGYAYGPTELSPLPVDFPWFFSIFQIVNDTISCHSRLLLSCELLNFLAKFELHPLT